MSRLGIIKVANVLTQMQSVRVELLSSAIKAKNGSTAKANIQDVRLGQLLHDASESIKDRFIEETLKIEE